MYTTEQVYTLGQLYKILSVAMRGPTGAKEGELQNATMYPARGVTLMITGLHKLHKITPELDRKIGAMLDSIPAEAPIEWEKQAIPLPLQGSFTLGYVKGAADIHPEAIGIKAARKAAGMTAAQLAEKVGVTTRQVQRWDSKDQIPPAPVAQKIADALGCSINDLF